MIFGKHIDKIAEPVRTLPKLLGRKLAKATAATALICQHVASLLLVRAGILPAACLLSLASLPFETRAAVDAPLRPCESGGRSGMSRSRAGGRFYDGGAAGRKTIK